VYNGLAAFMPQAGISPMLNGRRTFIIFYILLVISALFPLVVNGSPMDMKETLCMVIWLVAGIGTFGTTLNFIILARHLSKLLQHHLASTSTQMMTMRALSSTGRNGSMYSSHHLSSGGGVSSASLTSRGVREDELYHVVVRLRILIAIMMMSGFTVVPVYGGAALWPWLRARQSYFIPAVISMVSPIFILCIMTLK
jgi:hypothetical protein